MPAPFVALGAFSSTAAAASLPSMASISAFGSAAGTVMQAAGGGKGAKTDRRVSEYNAKVRERNKKMYEAMAEHRRFTAQREAVDLYEDGIDFVKNQQVQYRKAGVATGTGTPFLVALEMADRVEEKIRVLEYNAEIDAQELRERGVNEQLRANLTRAESGARRQAYRTQMYSSLLGAAGKVASIYK